MKSVRSRGRDMADEAGWNEPVLRYCSRSSRVTSRVALTLRIQNAFGRIQNTFDRNEAVLWHRKQLRGRRKTAQSVDPSI